MIYALSTIAGTIKTEHPERKFSCTSLSRLALLALTTLATFPLLAAPLHDYQLNSTYADALGGPSLSPDGGTLGPTGYTFAANQGLNISSIANGSVYSIDMVFQFTDVTGYRKILDFSNLGPDTGLYVHDGALNFYNVATGSSTIAANQITDVRLDRNTAGIVTGFVNGVQEIQFTDTGSIAVFDTPNQIMRFFEDDNATGQREASGGFVDSITIRLDPVPETSASVSLGLLLALSIGTLVATTRKRSLLSKDQ